MEMIGRILRKKESGMAGAISLFHAIVIGVLIGAGYLTVGAARTNAQEPPPWCNNLQCVSICIGNECMEGCVRWDGWACIGDEFGTEDGRCAGLKC